MKFCSGTLPDMVTKQTANSELKIGRGIVSRGFTDDILCSYFLSRHNKHRLFCDRWLFSLTCSELEKKKKKTGSLTYLDICNTYINYFQKNFKTERKVVMFDGYDDQQQKRQ